MRKSFDSYTSKTLENLTSTLPGNSNLRQNLKEIKMLGQKIISLFQFYQTAELLIVAHEDDVNCRIAHLAKWLLKDANSY